MDANKILAISTYAGRIMLESGGETYRVEDTVCRICEGYGFSAECFATLTGIMATLKDKDGNLTSIVVRITTRTTDLNKVHRINTLTRNVSRLDIDDFLELLKDIENEPKHPVYLNFFAYSFCAASFAFIFGGEYRDFLGASIIGAVLYIFIYFARKLTLNIFIRNCIGGGICAVTAVFLFRVGLLEHIDKPIIGSLMLLVPGIAITNAIRDIIAEDFMAGIARGAEALLIATSLAIGTGAALSLLL